MLALPIEVVCGGILPYLSVCDLQALDTAFTNKCLRPQLRQVWKSYQYACLDGITSDVVHWLRCVGAEVLEVKLVYNGNVDVQQAVDTLTHFKRLKQLLFDSFLTCISLTPLFKACPKLTVLCVPDCCFSHDSVSALSQHCHQLHTLHFKCNYFSDNAIQMIADRCRQISSLHVKSKDLTDAGIQALCDHCPYLKHIGLSYCHNLTDASLIAIAKSNIHLQSILLEEDNSFTDDGLIYFADKCHELRSVSVRCKNITSRGLTALWAANPNLMDVDISKNNFISDDDIVQLAKCCPLLQKLNLSHCFELTEAAVIAVAEHCPQLRSLNICYCYEVDDASLIAIGQHCHELKSIYIGESYITRDGVAAMADGCPLLQEFCARSLCDHEAIALARGCRNLHKVHLSDCCLDPLAVITAIAENCPLISFDLARCNIDDACLYVIAQHCHNLTYFERFGASICSTAAIEAVIKSCRSLREFRCEGCLRCYDENAKNALRKLASRLRVFEV